MILILINTDLTSYALESAINKIMRKSYIHVFSFMRKQWKVVFESSDEYIPVGKNDLFKVHTITLAKESVLKV